MPTLLDYLDLAAEQTAIDDRGRVVVPFLSETVLHAHARQQNRDRARQAETRVIGKRGLCHAS